MTFFIVILSIIGQNYVNPEVQDERNFSVSKLKRSFENTLNATTSFEELSKIDRRLLSKDLFVESEAVEKKLIGLVRKNGEYKNSALAHKYLSWAIEDLKKGYIEKGKRELEFAGKLDPSNRRILLTIVKTSFPNLVQTTKRLWVYLSSFGYLNNKVFLIKSFILFLIIFALWVLLATVGASIVFSLTYITKWIQRKVNLNGLWIGAILFAMFVWLPLQYVFLIIVAISLLKMDKTNLIKNAVILFLLPFLLSYSYIISRNFNPRSYLYKEFQARSNPYSYHLESPITPYGYSIKAIEKGKAGDFAAAKEFLEQGYNMRRDVNYLENLCSVYFAEGDTTKALNMCNNIVAEYPENKIAHITIINILYDQLKFDEADAHMKKTGFRLTDATNREPPIYNYPPVSWLYKYIFIPRGLFKNLAEKKLYLLIIIAICMFVSTFFKKETVRYCPICKSYMLEDRKNERLCMVCSTKLSLTKSKSIRERLKRRILAKAFKVDKFTNIFMSLIVPGSAHIYKKKHFQGIVICFFAAIFIVIFLYSIFSEPAENLKYKSYIGVNILKFALVVFYSVLIYSSWRLEPHGNGR
jgi:hypothetical protein